MWYFACSPSGYMGFLYVPKLQALSSTPRGFVYLFVSKGVPTFAPNYAHQCNIIYARIVRAVLILHGCQS